MMTLMFFLKNLITPIDNEEGQGMVEYALIIALIAIAVIAGLAILGPVISNKFIEIAEEITPST